MREPWHGSCSERHVPSPFEIVRLLGVMSRELTWLAVGWHVVVFAVFAAGLAGFRPSNRVIAIVLVALASSVAVAALAYANPFNALAFGILAVALAISSARHPPGRASLGPPWAVLLGSAVLLFGTCYPHFVVGPWYLRIMAAPVGVVPCPTLAVVGGTTLVLGAFGARALPALLAAWSAFYALFGILRLGVMLDAGLVASSVGLVALAIENARARRTSERAPRSARGSSRM
jgi:hypothetical protein